MSNLKDYCVITIIDIHRDGELVNQIAEVFNPVSERTEQTAGAKAKQLVLESLVLLIGEVCDNVRVYILPSERPEITADITDRLLKKQVYEKVKLWWNETFPTLRENPGWTVVSTYDKQIRTVSRVDFALEFFKLRLNLEGLHFRKIDKILSFSKAALMEEIMKSEAEREITLEK